MEIEICRGEKEREMDIEKRLYEAAREGDVRVLQEILQENALVLDRLTLNSFNETPLHIAAMRGHFEFVKIILSRSPQLAAELDFRKSSALHIASDKGYLEIVKELLVVNPEMCLVRDHEGRNPVHLAATKGRVEVIKELLQSRPSAALQTTNNGENVLHLCAKHYQLEALNVLMKIGTWDHEFLIAKDKDGETILNLANADQQNEKKSLKKLQKDDWIERKRNTLMIVASLIATMAFQAGLSPPSGVWQDDSIGHAGFSVYAYNDSEAYNRYVVSNTMGFVASLTVILLLISGLPIRRKGFMWILMFIMWIAISATAYAYCLSIAAFTPDNLADSVVTLLSILLIAWIGIMGLLFLIHTIRLIVKAIRKLKKSFVKKSNYGFHRLKSET